MSEQEIAELQEKITAQGLVVRDIKVAQKEGTASAEQVQAAVATLLQLKGQLPAELQAPPKKEKKADPAKDDRARKKEEKRLAREQASKSKSGVIEADTAPGVLRETYGDLPLAVSRDEDRKGRKWTHVGDLMDTLSDTQVLIRGYVHSLRAQSRNSFVVVRQHSSTVQCVLNDALMVKWSSTVPSESIVDVMGTLVKTPSRTATTQSMVEIQVETMFVVNRSSVSLPFEVVDADRTEAEVQSMLERAEKEGTNPPINVGQEQKLDFRHLSLRTPYQQAIVRISSGVCHYFRDFLIKQHFVEIQTPKLLGGQSESGAEVFTTEYFGKPCCLAQSPQLHKQILAACSGLERVFEIGPVFRAENSNTNRHLCEFHGLDLEMAFNEHYHEVLDMFSDLFHYIFEKLNSEYRREIETVRSYHHFEDLVFKPSEEHLPHIKTAGTNSKTLLLTFQDAISLLREDGVQVDEQGDLDDLSTVIEKRLGGLVKKKYGVDWYFVDKFPSEFRPFYTMPDPTNPDYSNSYDFFIRGQEILSGAQRVHDPELLSAKIAAKGIPVESIKFYVDAFRNGAHPHGGGGIGLERVVMLFLGLPNIRLACFFPRDPQRLTP